MKILSYKKSLSILIFLLCFCMSIFLWQNQNKYDRTLIMHQTNASAEQIQIRIEGMMTSRIASLDLLARRWVDRSPPDFSKQRFIRFAETVYGHYPGIHGINWIDPEGMFQWAFPEQNNTELKDKNIRQMDAGIRSTFERAQKTLEFETSPCLGIKDREIYFYTFWPLVFRGSIQGYFCGVFQVQKIMDICLGKNMEKNFCIRLYEDGQLIYLNEKQHKHQDESFYNRFRVIRAISFPGKTWQMYIEPRSSVFESKDISNRFFLFFAITISFILSVVFFLFLQRMGMYRNARDSALDEIEKRIHTEEALRENEKKLEYTMEKLVAKNTEMESFLYSISHDLKTPIVTIDGFIGALREDFGNDLPKSAQSYFEYISDATKKMGLLINDLIELSRIGRVNEKKMSLPFGEIVESATSMLNPQIEAKGISLNIQQDFPVVYGEKKRLVQVIENLISNAIKYIGKDNPAPRIEIGHKKNGVQNVFFVKDNGIGIQQRYQKIIFQVFQRLPDAKKAGEGTGIGLAIVERVIKHHEGEIWVSSEPGKGSTFFFTLNKSEV